MSRYTSDSVAAQLNQWIELYNADGATNALPKNTLDSLRNAGGRFIALQQGPQGMVMAQIVKQNAPVTICEYDEYIYTQPQPEDQERRPHGIRKIPRCKQHP